MTTQTAVTVTAPDFRVAQFKLTGTAPYVQARFGEKAMQSMRDKMLAGQKAKKGAAREARNFEEDYLNAMYESEDGWRGIPASSFRQACISACRLVGFKMTLAKLSLFVEADGLDKKDGTPLVKIEGEPEKVEHVTRNANRQPDIRVRGMWRDWSCSITVRYDAAQFALEDVANLIARVGLQVGIGEGRPDSKMSAGMGWGTFRVD